MADAIFAAAFIAEKEKIMQSGFIVQEAEKAAKELGYDFSGVDKLKNETASAVCNIQSL